MLDTVISSPQSSKMYWGRRSPTHRISPDDSKMIPGLPIPVPLHLFVDPIDRPYALEVSPTVHPSEDTTDADNIHAVSIP
jgi:hypothetical protein